MAAHLLLRGEDGVKRVASEERAAGEGEFAEDAALAEQQRG